MILLVAAMTEVHRMADYVWLAAASQGRSFRDVKFTIEVPNWPSCNKRSTERPTALSGTRAEVALQIRQELRAKWS